MEGYFLKKRLEIAAQKPELIIKDDASELRFELYRKDELLKKNHEKINYWQSILADLQAAGTQQSMLRLNQETRVRVDLAVLYSLSVVKPRHGASRLGPRL